VHHERLVNCARKMCQPVRQGVAICVRRQAIDGENASPDRRILTVYLNRFVTVHNFAPERAGSLETGEYDGALLARKVGTQMPVDSSGIAHCAGRDNQRTVLHFGKCLAFHLVINETDARPVAMVLYQRIASTVSSSAISKCLRLVLVAAVAIDEST